MGNPQLEVQPIAGALGAEVHGVDLAKDVDDETFDAIHQVLLDHGAIMFRDQDITPEQQLALAERWGAIHLHPHIPGLEGYPGIFEIVKNPEDVTLIGGNWHSDQMFTPTPVRVTMLYAKELPPAGGDTMFANLYLAYETLSDGMKAMLDGLRTVNLYDKKKQRPGVMKPTKPDEPAESAEHPLIRTHAETGRKALYLSYEGITRQIAGMTEEESKPILSYLMSHATRPEFTCRFRWEPGSLGLWDNRCVQHLAVNDYNGYRRVMHRITIEGEATS
jgi:taurine dioxygenase